MRVAAFAMLAGAVLCGCPQAVPVVAPVANFAACVATDALKGVNIGQIVADCGGDAIAVVTELLGSSDPQVQATPAYGEAKLDAKKVLGAHP